MVHDFPRNLILAKLRENKVQHLIGSHVELTYGTELKLFNLLMFSNVGVGRRKLSDTDKIEH